MLLTVRVQEGRGAGDAHPRTAGMFRNSRATAPFEQGFHPEFGYFSPSAALRRRVRVVAKLTLVGAAVVAAAALALSSALFPPPVREALREEPVVMPASAPQSPDGIAPGPVSRGQSARSPSLCSFGS